ncbi:nucleotidyltransferase domain-containing protein [Paraburkholderia aspalathi]|uniref:nucleotidyltransferase domain-containing protein n=1 Tax=Paraburkholderia nemoris TaxID=2793076 RepID=UPI00190A03B1|nr:nucleotidyltransferase domain-containing protein [Paraburkholderia nemoris]MBK3786665.1 nucleotidyltransferase domain-containing protein [Paraburkholderia aspalathi]
MSELTCASGAWQSDLPSDVPGSLEALTKILGVSVSVFASATENRYAVILGGSVSAGLGGPSSDLDFLVLIDSDRDSEFPFPVQSTLVFPRGVPSAVRQVDVEFVFASDVKIFGKFLAEWERRRVSAATSDDFAITRNLNSWELSVCHQITSGHRLKNPDVAGRWIEDHALHRFAAYVFELNLALAERHIRDGIRMRGGNAAASHSVRMACEHCAMCVLALMGETNPNRKWLVMLLQRMSGSEDRLRIRNEILSILQGSALVEMAERVKDIVERLSGSRPNQ